MFPNRSNDD